MKNLQQWTEPSKQAIKNKNNYKIYQGQ